jgi:FKBP-type peptidyl-prolyl cis-trans isomerase FkpA
MNKITILLSSALIVGLTSCNKSKYDGYKTAENGLNYKFYTQDEKGTKVMEGDGVAFKYVFKLLSNDSILINSATTSQDGTGITRFVLPKSSFQGSLEDAMKMMSKNDSASFIISADSFYLKTQRAPSLPPFLKPGDMLKVEMKMVEIKSKKELEENQKQQEKELAKMSEEEKPQIMQYVTDNKITVAPTSSGLYYTETQKGKGSLAQAGNEVTVNYTGKLLNGTVFDSSVGKPEPFKFIVGQGMVIPGWDEAFLKMAKGGKATLLIPSSIAYGSRGAGGVIPPFAPLVFEVELLDINTTPAPPQQQQMPGQ